jgi:hypothetical protein
MSIAGDNSLPFDDVANVFCHTCRMCDGSLRYSEHPRVISTLLRTSTSRRVGIWCARCRGIEAAKAAAVSIVAGWWSARGPMETIAALRANLAGGEIQPSLNARMLRAIARHEYDAGNHQLAASFSSAAHATQPQRENASMLSALAKAGYATSVAPSPWRFAAWAPVVVFIFVVALVGMKMFRKPAGVDAAVAAPATAQQASVLAQPLGRASKADDVQWKWNASADELEKMLTPDSPEKLARAYVRTRMRELRSSIPQTVRHGDSLSAAEQTILGFQQYPALAALISTPLVNDAYSRLRATFSDAARYYHGGAPADAIERVAGESLNVTAKIEIAAFDAEMRGFNERSDALNTQVDARIDSLMEMKRELRVRSAVIGVVSKAIDDFDRALGGSSR